MEAAMGILEKKNNLEEGEYDIKVKIKPLKKLNQDRKRRKKQKQKERREGGRERRKLE